MRSFLFSLFAAVMAPAVFTQVSAQAPEGFELIYDEPTNVNLGGRWVVADIAFYADKEAAAQGDLHLALVTDVTKFIEETERDLENWVATNQERCGERWGAGDPEITFPTGAIRFVLELELEVWNCGWNGKGKPGRIAREAGTIDVTLDAFVESGKLQAALQAFSIDEREGVSKYLPLEFVARRVVNAEIRKLNENRKFYRSPKPLFGKGFRYQSIAAKREPDGSVIITARYKAKGSAETLDSLVEKIREDGITQ